MSTTRKYASETTVSVAQSRNEIERLLERYGAQSFMYGTHGNKAMISFELQGRRIRIMLTYPAQESFNRTKSTPLRAGIKRTPAQAKAAYEQEIKRLWRGLTMIIKAKLEAVASGITTLEDEFMSGIVLPNNQTVGEYLAPQIESIYKSGKMPPLLPGANSDRVYEGELVD